VLDLIVYSPMDLKYREYLGRWWQRQRFLSRGDLLEHRYEYSFLRLLNDDLPTVSRISLFRLLQRVKFPRNIEGAGLVAIAAKLPNLELIRNSTITTRSSRFFGSSAVTVRQISLRTPNRPRMNMLTDRMITQTLPRAQALSTLASALPELKINSN
jgi:hypothetical protein